MGAQEKKQRQENAKNTMSGFKLAMDRLQDKLQAEQEQREADEEALIKKLLADINEVHNPSSRRVPSVPSPRRTSSVSRGHVPEAPRRDPGRAQGPPVDRAGVHEAPGRDLRVHCSPRILQDSGRAHQEDGLSSRCTLITA